jgi:type 1 glutamine amidotransferase
MKNKYIILILGAILIALLPSCNNAKSIKTLIVTGQGGETWMMTNSEAVKQILDETGLFSVKILPTPPAGKNLLGFNPSFSKYKLIIVDYSYAAWPEKTIIALKDYVNNGGGVVIYNSKNNPWVMAPDSITISDRQNFEVRMLASDHPVAKGLPGRWFHPDDIIIKGLQPAGEESEIIATASSSVPGGPRGRRPVPVPVLIAKNSGQGRIFITMLGSPDDKENKALHCSGFIVTLQRGAEWAATGAVSQEIPFDFPTAAGAVTREGFKGVDFEEAFENLVSYDISKSTLYFTWLQSQIRKASGDEATLLNLEKKMVEVLKNSKSTIDAKKLILRELSWMGTEYSIPAIKELSSVEELKDDVSFALKRLQ